MKTIKKFLLLFILSSLSHSIFAQGIDKPRYQIITHRAGIYLGTIEIELFPFIAPLATANFDSLVNVLAYDSTAFHRVVPGFVIQGGDPNSINGPISTWGQGQPGQPNVPAEFSVARHERGRIGAARDANINSANSQFYICVAPAYFLDGQYTVYGEVTSGMNIVDTIVNSPRDINDVPLQKIEMFITYLGVNDTVPQAPVLNTPLDNAISINLNQNLTWNAVSDGVIYTLEISDDSLFSNIITTKVVGITNSTIIGLSPYTTYYWRVKVNNGGHESPWSSFYRFTTLLSNPILISPPDSSTNVYLNPIFTWDSLPGALTYLLQVATSTSFSTGSLVYNQSGITGTSQQVGGLNPSTNYYWRMRGNDGNTFGQYSVKFLFTTGTTIGLTENPTPTNQLRINKVYPNPASSVIHIEAYTKENALLTVELKDLQGKLVYQQEIVKSPAATTFEIPVHQLSKGFYILKLSSHNEEAIKNIEIR
ncbi:hypothetical protein BH11BAC2_BH11BAC2_20160 [soil metagenome]